MERDLIQGIPQVDIEDKSAIAKEAVGTEVIGRQEKKRQRVQTYVEGEAPWHRVILEKIDLSGMSIRYIRKATTLITNNRRLRKISPEGIITTVAGNGVAEFSGEGCPPIKASLNLPYGIDIDGSGGGESLQELLDGTIVDHLEPSHLLWSRTKRADGSHVPLTPPRTSKGSYGSRIPVRVVDGEAVY